MRILFVLPEYPPDHGGGIITFYRDLVSALRADGLHISILKGSAFVRGGASYCHDGVEVSVLTNDRYEKWYHQLNRFLMFPELRRHLAAAFAMHEQAASLGSFDAVEVTDWGMLFLPWVLGGDSRVTVQMHGSCGQIAYREPVAGREVEGILTRLLEQTALRSAAKVCTHSRSNALWWERGLGRVVELIPPPFAHSPATAEQTRAGWLAIGRVQHWKGPEVVCKAWVRLGGNAPLLEWHGRDVIHGQCGTGTGGWLRKQYPCVWGSSIRWLEQLTPAEVHAKMIAAAVVVIPSLWDVYNLVTAEAMAAGCVVLVSNGAGAVDLIDHGVNGFVFSEGDDEALAELAREVIRMSPQQRFQMGRAARETVIERLAPKRIAQEKLGLYQRVVEGEPEISEWLFDFLTEPPSASKTTFLDTLPLRKLAAYVAQRGLEKLIKSLKK